MEITTPKQIDSLGFWCLIDGHTVSRLGLQETSEFHKLESNDFGRN